MNVVLLNHSDTLGGASVVTMRLMNALVRLGADARMLVMNASRPGMRVEQLQPAWRKKAAFLAEAAHIYIGNGLSRENLFKVSIARYGMPVHRHPWVKNADVVVLNWVNQGMLSLEEIARIEVPAVWAMHDMWPFTGVCHHAGICNRYVASCGFCPFLHSGTHASDLSSSTHSRKARLYSEKKIRFVAVSNWLADLCRQSSLCCNADVSVIPNAFPIENFKTEPTLGRKALGLPDGPIIAFGAARIDDPVKGLDLAIDALNRLHDSGIKANVVFFGALRDGNALSRLRMPYVHLGMIAEPDRIPQILSHADVILSSSHYETLPGTIIEGMAAGAVPVAFLHGGQADIITHLSNGYLARYPDTADLAAGISWALTEGRTALTRLALHKDVAIRFSSQSVANRYLDLFNTL